MICPVVLTHDVSALKKWSGGARLESELKPNVFRIRDGADDETTGRAVEGDGKEDHLVGGGGDHRGKRPDDAAVAGTAGGRRLFGSGGPAQGQSQRTACSAEDSRRDAGLYREQYSDFNVRHFHEKLREQHGIDISYTWVYQALTGAGLVAKRRRRAPHRRRRERRPMPGMLLHIDGSKHRWFQDDRWYDLLVILDDATSEICYAQLVEEESTRTVMRGLRR